MLFSQRLAWGYDLDQPPLYTWLLMGVQFALGLTPAAGLAFNYGLWLLTVALFYVCAHRILGDAEHAALATLALLSLNTIGWTMHETLTHTMLLMACCAAGLWAFLALVDRGGLLDYLLFGAVLGAGVLSKYNFLGFLICLFGAAALQPALRERLLRREMLLSLSLALAVVSPHLLWVWSEIHHREVLTLYRTVAKLSPNESWAARALRGLVSLPAPIVGFLSPLLVVTAALIPGAFRARANTPPAPDLGGKPDLVRLVRGMLLIGGLLLLLGVLAGAGGWYREISLHPFLLFAPIYLMARIQWARPPARRRRLFIAAPLLYPP